MLDERYLVMGVDALSRAHTMNFFADGHRGGAMVSAYFLCREGGVEDGAAALLGTMIDREYGGTPLCAPFPEQAPDPALAGKLAHEVTLRAAGLRMAGHNVILPALALKAFHHAPALITPARVEGLCSLVRSFSEADPVAPLEKGEIPEIADTPAWAAFVLEELLRVFKAFDGRGQGWSGHLLTFSRALLDLRACGHGDVAEAALHGWRCYLRRVRKGPLEKDIPRSEHAEALPRPHERRYWEARQGQTLGLGHMIKYPYGYHGITSHVGDRTLLARCDAEVYRIF